MFIMSLQLLLRDFSYHNIEMTCVLLEHCGRYLYRSPDSHPRAKALLVRTHFSELSYVLYVVVVVVVVVVV